jgi:hypothetical protein
MIASGLCLLQILFFFAMVFSDGRGFQPITCFAYPQELGTCDYDVEGWPNNSAHKH